MIKKNWLHIIFIILSYALAMLAIVGGAYFRAGLDATLDMPSAERIRAPHILENVRETERSRQFALELAQELETVYTIDPGVWQFVNNNLETLRTDIAAIRTAYAMELDLFEAALAQWEADDHNRRVEEDRANQEWQVNNQRAMQDGLPPPPSPEFLDPPPPPEREYHSLEMFAGLHMLFSEDERLFLVGLAHDNFANMWTATFEVAEHMQIHRRIDEIDFAIERTVRSTITGLDVLGLDRAMEDIIENIVLEHLRTNVIPDEERNQQNFVERANTYERVWIQEGQIIVDEGEIITEDIYFLLGQFGMLRSESMAEHIIPMIGVGVLVLVLFSICGMYLIFYSPTTLASKKEAGLMFTIYVLSLLIAWVLRDFNLPIIALMIFPMLVSLLIDRRCAILLTFVMVLICFFIVQGNLAYLLFYTTAGAIICLLSRFSTERNKIFIVGLMITAIQFGLAIAITLIIERSHAFADYQALFLPAAMAAISGMLTVIICTGSLPLWETLFGVVTPVKLLDLTNPTNQLLRRLTIEAPGTYHHSLIVANLAEAAAYDIGANAHAARVGGYYHDVGKLKYPHNFAENLDGDNPHDHLDPWESAEIIISHVAHGLQLAAEHRLPQFVRDIIREHHGTSMIYYFYSKARELYPHDTDEADYRYPYIIPQTRESACVMLADSVEAAVRANMPKMSSIDEVETTIRKVVRGKLSDNLLADSQLSIKDVSVIEQSFFRVLKGMYHERIVYPKEKSPTKPLVRVTKEKA